MESRSVVDSGRLLAELEAIIERGMQTFVEVGHALMEIREQELYLHTHATFAAYCHERWGLGRAHAYRLMEAATVVAELSPIGDAPLRESQARELARVDPPHRTEVWQRAVQAFGEQPTAAQIRQVAAAEDRRRNATTKSPMSEGALRELFAYVQDDARQEQWAREADERFEAAHGVDAEQARAAVRVAFWRVMQNLVTELNSIDPNIVIWALPPDEAELADALGKDITRWFRQLAKANKLSTFGSELLSG